MSLTCTLVSGEGETGFRFLRRTYNGNQWLFSVGVKRLERDADHLHLVLKVRICVWIYAFAPTYAVMSLAFN